MRKTTRVVLALLLALSLIVVACGDDEGEETTTTAGEETTTTAGEETTTTAGEETTTTAGEETTTTAAGLAAPPTPTTSWPASWPTTPASSLPYGTMLTGEPHLPDRARSSTLDPPLGRHWDFVAEDIGTVGEAAAAHKLIEEDGVDILISPAHGYGTYRTWFIEWESRARFAARSVGARRVHPVRHRRHGCRSRSSGRRARTRAWALIATIYACEIGAQTVVIFATQVEGFQLAADAAEEAVPVVGGIEVLARIDVPGSRRTATGPRRSRSPTWTRMRSSWRRGRSSRRR